MPGVPANDDKRPDYLHPVFLMSCRSFGQEQPLRGAAKPKSEILSFKS